MIASLLAALAIVAVLGWLHVLREARRQRERLDASSEALERLQNAFARFAPDALVERIASTGLPAQGERREVTVLFADLVGFTQVAEALPPDALLRVLNGYFARMSQAISEHHGHLSTLIGDGILALFGAIERNPWHSDDAVRAALAMQRAIAAYNRELAAESLPSLALGIGLHRGTGIAGLVGSPELLQFTVVGRVVNVAARLEELTRVYGVDVLLTTEVREAIDPAIPVRALSPSRVRGFAEPIQVFALDPRAGSVERDDYHV